MAARPRPGARRARPTRHRPDASASRLVRPRRRRSTPTVTRIALVAVGPHGLGRVQRRPGARPADAVAVLLERRHGCKPSRPCLVRRLVQPRGVLDRDQDGKRPTVPLDQEALAGRGLVQDAAEGASQVERGDRSHRPMIDDYQSEMSGLGRSADGCRALCYCRNDRAGVTQPVECLLPKQDVAGSNPVSRSTIPLENSPRARAPKARSSCPGPRLGIAPSGRT